MCWMSSKWAIWHDPNSWSSICVSAYAYNMFDSYGWIHRKWLTAAVVPHESKSICLHVKFSSMKLNLMIDKQYKWAESEYVSSQVHIQYGIHYTIQYYIVLHNVHCTMYIVQHALCALRIYVVCSMFCVKI